MKRPIILEGKPFDWDEGAEAMRNVVNEDGDVNWRAAFCADPGCVQCPGCKEYLWREGTKIKCPDCETEFDTYKSKD